MQKSGNGKDGIAAGPIRHLYKFTISHRWNGAWKTSRFVCHMPEADTDWLNPLSLGTMSASAYIDNLA